MTIVSCLLAPEEIPISNRFSFSFSSADNDDVENFFDSGMNSMNMPSPALSASDDDSDGLRNSTSIRNWQSGTHFGQTPDRARSSVKWDFGNPAAASYTEDAVMSSGLASPRGTGSSSPAAVEIRVDAGDVAEAASGVDMSTAAHMDELE